MKWVHFFHKVKKEKETSKRREFIVPDESTEVIFALLDARRKENTFVAKYRLWDAIGKLFPETRTGTWGISTAEALRVRVFEVLEEAPDETQG